MSRASRVIDAAEYDAAARQTPDECPLLAMGDLRSGRQLLDDFAADSRRTVSRMSESRRGHPPLRRQRQKQAQQWPASCDAKRNETGGGGGGGGGADARSSASRWPPAHLRWPEELVSFEALVH